jgi:hypothetical protein
MKPVIFVIYYSISHVIIRMGQSIIQVGQPVIQEEHMG